MKGVYLYRPLGSESYPKGIEGRAPKVLATWLRYFPQSTPIDRDEEDWIENAILLHEADAAGLEVEILKNEGRVHVVSSGWMSPPARPGARKGMMLGAWTTRDLLEGPSDKVDIVGTTQQAVKAAGDYAASKTYLRHAGRAIALAKADEDSIEEALQQVVRETGSGDIFIKTVQKEWAASFSVDPDRGGLWDQLCDQDRAIEEGGYGLDWIPVQHEGSSSNILMVQGKIVPTFEYRMFIVDGAPVTGAGCIEAFTPAENLEIFDAQMEEKRNSGLVVTRDDIRDRYHQFAAIFCKEFAEEHGEGLDFSLDLCIDAQTGEIKVIELNPPINLGRYASDVGAWLAAAVARTERLAA